MCERYEQKNNRASELPSTYVPITSSPKPPCDTKRKNLHAHCSDCSLLNAHRIAVKCMDLSGKLLPSCYNLDLRMFFSDLEGRSGTISLPKTNLKIPSKYHQNAYQQGRIHGIRCVHARTASNFGRKQYFCWISTRV